MEHLKGSLVPRAVQLNQVGPGRMRYGICWLVWDELAYSCDLLRSSDLLLGCLEESGRTCCLSSCLLVHESIGCLHFCNPSLVSSLSPFFLFPSLSHFSFSLFCHLCHYFHPCYRRHFITFCYGHCDCRCRSGFEVGAFDCV